jgi:CPA2 family monovalent cation:H+ antiporter-2
VTPVVAAAADDVALVFVELGAIFLGLAFLARLALRAGLSPVPVYLLAGLAFGDGGLAPLSLSRDFIEVAAEIGVVLLLLALGLEYSADELSAGLRRGMPSGVLDLALNFPPGFAAALLLGWSIESAILLGGVTYISSSGVVAKLLRDLGRLGNRETPEVLTILVIEDLVMAIYLPLVGVMLAGRSGSAAAGSLGLTMLLVVVALVVALRFGGLLTRLVRTPNDEPLLLGVLGLTLLAAGAAQQADISTAVGAFLVGVALASDVSHHAQRLIGPLRDLFAATFFVIFALEIDPADIVPLAGTALALVAVTAATKYAVGAWAARRAGVGPVGQRRAGTVLVARGEFSIVIAGLGVGADVVDPDLGVLTAAYVLCSAVVGPILTRLADNRLPRWPDS